MRKDVRVWFSKTGTARYISHLDLNRCMSRAFHKAKLPLWYTEGFNPHVFLTFAAPLSLGFEGRRESMDIRLIEEIPYAELIEKLNAGLPHDIRVYAVTEPEMKGNDVANAEYVLRVETEEGRADGGHPALLCGYGLPRGGRLPRDDGPPARGQPGRHQPDAVPRCGGKAARPPAFRACRADVPVRRRVPRIPVTGKLQNEAAPGCGRI